MTERERELTLTVWFFALMAAVLLVIIGINLPAIQGDSPPQPTRILDVDQDDCNPPTLIICKEHTP